MKLLTMENSKIDEHIFVLCASTWAATRRARAILKAYGEDLDEFWTIDIHEATNDELKREGWDAYANL